MTGHNIIKNFITARVCPVADPEGSLPGGGGGGGGGEGLTKSAQSDEEEGSGRGEPSRKWGSGVLPRENFEKWM